MTGIHLICFDFINFSCSITLFSGLHINTSPLARGYLKTRRVTMLSDHDMHEYFNNKQKIRDFYSLKFSVLTSSPNLLILQETLGM